MAGSNPGYGRFYNDIHGTERTKRTHDVNINLRGSLEKTRAMVHTMALTKQKVFLSDIIICRRIQEVK